MTAGPLHPDIPTGPSPHAGGGHPPSALAACYLLTYLLLLKAACSVLINPPTPEADASRSSLSHIMLSALASSAGTMHPPALCLRSP